MTNKERVIKGLEGVYRCISPVNHTCGDCPYQDNHVECIRRVVSDAIALLKDQEPILLENQHKPYGISTNANSPWISRCPKCGKKVEGKQTRFCKYCGRSVKWE